MIETAMIKEALTYTKKYYGDRKDECGKPIIERILWVAERMDDEMTACTALLQDFMYERLREWPSMRIPSPVYNAMNILFYYEDMPTRQIAQTLHISETAVRSRLFQARKALKTLLGGDANG